jgi:hypothetical protein
MDKVARYHSIVDAIHLAVDAEQPEGGPHPYTERTERCLYVVYKLLQEALEIKVDPNA